MNARYWGIVLQEKRKMEIILSDGSPITKIDTKTLEPEMYDVNILIGMCGFENIEWENRLGEISLLLNPGYPPDEYGKEALSLVLYQGFMILNLENIYTEIYECSLHRSFWVERADKYNASLTGLSARKYYNGRYYDSYYINFNKGAYNENTILESACIPS
jgi:hypothetical protein